MKIAISVKDEMFKEVETFAKKRHCSRSAVFSMAVKDFLEKVKSQRLLEAVNEAYSEAETAEEARVRASAKKRYRSNLKERY